MPKSKAVEVLDAAIAAVRRVRANDDPTTWMTHVRTVEAGVVVGDLAAPRPAVYVTMSFGPDEPQMSGPPHYHDMAFQVHLLILVDQADGGRQALRVADDVKRAVANDELLSTNAAAAGLLMLPLVFEKGEYDLEAADRYGVAAFRVTYGSKYRWSHDAA